jgi:hypothetical protein
MLLSLTTLSIEELPADQRHRPLEIWRLNLNLNDYRSLAVSKVSHDQVGADA